MHYLYCSTNFSKIDKKTSHVYMYENEHPMISSESQMQNWHKAQNPRFWSLSTNRSKKNNLLLTKWQHQNQGFPFSNIWRWTRHLQILILQDTIIIIFNQMYIHLQNKMDGWKKTTARLSSVSQLNNSLNFGLLHRLFHQAFVWFKFILVCKGFSTVVTFKVLYFLCDIIIYDYPHYFYMQISFCI